MKNASKLRRGLATAGLAAALALTGANSAMATETDDTQATDGIEYRDDAGQLVEPNTEPGVIDRSGLARVEIDPTPARDGEVLPGGIMPIGADITEVDTIGVAPISAELCTPRSSRYCNRRVRNVAVPVGIGSFLLGGALGAGITAALMRRRRPPVATVPPVAEAVTPDDGVVGGPVLGSQEVIRDDIITDETDGSAM
ncbi:MAG: hypothetical protein FWG25_00175 [Promicromonosporaceae bacterium]|nr:hypothetical protein [Promicromonosporaceae bacterium]